jgi:putative peptidoglycan lipid II flippase
MLAYGLSAISGYARDFALAYRLGTTRVGDVFFVGYTALDIVAAAIVPAITAGVVPSLAHASRVSRLAESRLAASIIAIAAVIGTAGAISLLLLAPWLAQLLAPGMQDADRSQVSFTLMLLSPATGLLLLAGTIGAVLLSRAWFLAASIGTPLFNAAVATAVLLVGPLDSSKVSVIFGMIAGCESVLLAALLLRSGRVSMPDLASFRAGVRAFAATLPIGAAFLTSYLPLVVDRAAATTVGAGAVAELNFAWRLAGTVNQVIGSAVGAALFPQLSHATALGDWRQIRHILRGGGRLIAILCASALALVVPLRSELVGVLYGHGKFAQSAVSTVALLGAVLVVAFSIDSFAQPFWRVAFAARRWLVVLAMPLVQVLVHVGVLLSLLSSLGLLAVPLAVLSGLTVQDALLSWRVSRWVGGVITKADFVRLVIILLAFVPLFALLTIASLVMVPGWRWPMEILAVPVGCAVAVYVLAQAHIPEAMAITFALRTTWGRISHASA